MSDYPSTLDPADDPGAINHLDQLVANAYRLPSDELRIARLEMAWRRERQVTRRRAWVKSLAAAASIALLGIVIWGRVDRPANPPMAQQAPIPDRLQDCELLTGEVVDEIPKNAARIVGQTPDRLREVLFTVRTAELPRGKVSLSELLSNYESLPPNEAQQEILAATGWRAAELRRRIASELAKLPPASQPLAIGLLAQQADEASIRILQQLARQDVLQPICLEHLFEITDGREPAVLLQGAKCHDLCHWLLEGASDDPRRVECYLALVSHPATRGAALEALAGIVDPPVFSFLIAIDSDQRHDRFAAALALGQLGGSEVAQPLIELVTGRHRRNAEAWLAIVACDSPLAEEFLAHAARDPLLLGHYNAARLRRQQMIP